MLYDKKWDKQIETEADPFTLQGLIKWLETKDPTTKYEFCDIGDCLLGQYFQERTGRGLYYSVAATIAYEDRDPNLVPLYKVASGGNHTFGAALQRAREALRADD